jgi:hypothetical protein
MLRSTARPPYLSAGNERRCELVTHTVKPITAATASRKTIIHPRDERRSVKVGGVMGPRRVFRKNEV